MRVRAAWIVLVLACGCRTFEPAKTAEGALVEVPATEFPAFSDDLAYDDLVTSLDQSLTWLRKIAKADPERTFGFGVERVPIAKVVATLERFRALALTSPDPVALNATIREEFRVFRSTGGDAEGHVLFTGYYLPELRGSLVRDEAHPVPLYALPDDVVVAKAKKFPQLESDLVGRVVGGEFVPYATREEIVRAGLDPHAKVVAWVDSAVDAFFLEIQGSGLVRFADGSSRVVTFAGRNGHRYVAVGAELARRGAIAREALSMQTIRAWLAANPGEAQALMNTNPSYVFFRESEAAKGSLDVPVTPGRSLATDKKVFPAGALCFIETERPVDATSEAWRPFARFMLDQDTGGAIRTAGHVDVFWGSGEYAAHAAGRMKQQGRLYYLLLR